MGVNAVKITIRILYSFLLNLLMSFCLDPYAIVYLIANAWQTIIVWKFDSLKCPIFSDGGAPPPPPNPEPEWKKPTTEEGNGGEGGGEGGGGDISSKLIKNFFKSFPYNIYLL